MVYSSTRASSFPTSQAESSQQHQSGDLFPSNSCCTRILHPNKMLNLPSMGEPSKPSSEPHASRKNDFMHIPSTRHTALPNTKLGCFNRETPHTSVNAKACTTWIKPGYHKQQPEEALSNPASSSKAWQQLTLL